MFKKTLLSLAALAMLSGGGIVAEAIQPTVENNHMSIAPKMWLNALGTINANNVHFRTGPGTNHTALGQVHRNATVRHTGQWQMVSGHFWERVTIQSGTGSNNNAGRTGWIRGDFISNWR